MEGIEIPDSVLKNWNLDKKTTEKKQVQQDTTPVANVNVNDESPHTYNMVIVSYVVSLFVILLLGKNVYDNHNNRNNSSEFLDLRHYVEQAIRSARCLPHGHIKINK